jgi:hypothetical protein
MQLTTGALFFIIAIVAFFVWATQAGAKESKFGSSPTACIVFFIVVALVLYGMWSGAHIAVLTHH